MPHCGVIPSLRLTDALQGELGSLSLTLCLLQSIHSRYHYYIYLQQHTQVYNHNPQNTQESRKRGNISTTKHAMSSNDDVDAWVAQLMQCKPLSELEVKKLCEKVSLAPSLTIFEEMWCCLDWDVVWWRGKGVRHTMEWSYIWTKWIHAIERRVLDALA